MAIDVEHYYRRYGPMVVRRCRQLLKDEDRAMEAAQDVFVELVRRQQSLTEESPSGLLLRMATNTCLNILRSQRRHPEDADTLLERIAGAADHEAQVIARLRLDRIFRREQPSTRLIAVLHLVDGLTLEEVAREVGLSVSGVRKRLRTLRARALELEGV
ncbi:sigma-70 family RNA polymerase sigma factor [Candidatus Fermentibacteria bacterium]|nr:sigma-70 family RNA polymerase sigma factor [Candidatus Fermentibacteria bacterium]